MSWWPVGHRLEVEIEVVPEKTAGGLWIPTATVDRDMNQNDVGIVRKIGSCCWTDKGDGSPWAKVGDRVEFIKHAGKIGKDDNSNTRTINDLDVLNVWRED